MNVGVLSGKHEIAAYIGGTDANLNAFFGTEKYRSGLVHLENSPSKSDAQQNGASVSHTVGISGSRATGSEKRAALSVSSGRFSEILTSVENEAPG